MIDRGTRGTALQLCHHILRQWFAIYAAIVQVVWVRHCGTLKRCTGGLSLSSAVLAAGFVESIIIWICPAAHAQYEPPGYVCTYAGCCPRGYSVQGGVCKPYRGPEGGSHYRAYGYAPGYAPRGYVCTYAGCCPRGYSVQDGICKPYRGY